MKKGKIVRGVVAVGMVGASVGLIFSGNKSLLSAKLSSAPSETVMSEAPKTNTLMQPEIEAKQEVSSAQDQWEERMEEQENTLQEDGNEEKKEQTKKKAKEKKKKEPSEDAKHQEESKSEQESVLSIEEETPSTNEELSEEPSKEPQEQPQEQPQPQEQQAVNVVAAEPERAAQTPKSDSVVIALTGDVMPSASIVYEYNKNGINGILSEELKNELTAADITLVNQEFSLADAGSPMAGKNYTFRLEPSYVSLLQDMGTDIVNLANNHALDYGQQALEQTFDVLTQNQIAYVGAGQNVERASEMQVIEKNGKKIGFLSATRILPKLDWNVEQGGSGVLGTYDATRLNQAIRDARAACDYLIVYVHWGKEHKQEPESYARELAQGYLDAGADVVVGAHPHNVQGIEWYQGKPIFYSLGNLMFDDPQAERGVILKITVGTEQNGYQLLPFHAERYRTDPVAEKTEALQYVQSKSTQTTIDENGMVQYVQCY